MKKYTELSIHQKINIKAKLVLDISFTYRTETIYNYRNVLISDSRYTELVMPNYRTIQNPKHFASIERALYKRNSSINKILKLKNEYYDPETYIPPEPNYITIEQMNRHTDFLIDRINKKRQTNG